MVNDGLLADTQRQIFDRPQGCQMAIAQLGRLSAIGQEAGDLAAGLAVETGHHLVIAGQFRNPEILDRGRPLAITEYLLQFGIQTAGIVISAIQAPVGGGNALAIIQGGDAQLHTGAAAPRRH